MNARGSVVGRVGARERQALGGMAPVMGGNKRFSGGPVLGVVRTTGSEGSEDRLGGHGRTITAGNEGAGCRIDVRQRPGTARKESIRRGMMQCKCRVRHARRQSALRLLGKGEKSKKKASAFVFVVHRHALCTW